MKNCVLSAVIIAVVFAACANRAMAHHVLGRPAYTLNEDSNTPPSMQAEVLAGDYLISYMAFPAFPKPGKPGRISLYILNMEDGTPYSGDVTFRVRADTLLSKFALSTTREMLGTQPPVDHIFRQGFQFHRAGAYIVSAEFLADGELHFIDFPLRVGAPPRIGTLGVIVALLLVVFAIVTLVQRRRALVGRIRGAHQRRREKQ